MGYKRRGAPHIIAWLIVALTAGCGTAEPLQSPLIPTATRIIFPTETDVPTDTPTPTLTPTITQTPTPGPSPTPDTRATSEAVYATITALAATPTYPPTSTPRPRRTPIIAGPDEAMATPTPLFQSGGIAVQTLSQEVFPGGAAALTIQTQPGAVCTLRVERTEGESTRAEPIPTNPTLATGRDGVAAWLWTVDAKEPAGMMTLLIDCGAAGQARVQIRVVES